VFLERTIDNIKQYVPWQAVELLFNPDEVSVSDWEDRCEKSMIVPTVFKGRMIHHKVKRSTKHAIALACVTAGDVLRLYLVISRKSNQEFCSSGLGMANAKTAELTSDFAPAPEQPSAG
jgi:hypothetical protein